VPVTPPIDGGTGVVTVPPVLPTLPVAVTPTQPVDVPETTTPAEPAVEVLQDAPAIATVAALSPALGAPDSATPAAMALHTTPAVAVGNDADRVQTHRRADGDPAPASGYRLGTEGSAPSPAPSSSGGTGGGASGAQPNVGASAVVPDAMGTPTQLRQALTPNEKTGHSALLASAKYRPD
jgi:hypothetical protein